MPTTTADLWSAQTVRDLVTEPLFRASVVLASGLTRISSAATKTYIPRVGGGTAAWPAGLSQIHDPR